MRASFPRLIDRRSVPHRQYLRGPGARPVSAPGLYPGEPENCRRRALDFLSVLSQMAALLAVFATYRLETASFRALAALATAALPFHYLAPYRWKKPIFVAVSILGMFLVVGPATGACVLALASVLIGVAVAPAPWRVRVGLIAALAALLAVFRPAIGYGDEVAAAGAVPVLASMFMFRMIVLMYELKHAKRSERLIDVLGFFFLLPNFSFLHFPVVDYRTFQRGHFAGEVHEVQRAGLAMMFRGTVHLLLYRVIYHNMLVPVADVRTPGSLALHLACNYLLYLRVSGQFHMACGMLHLFGFQLPETHRRYLLATSFTDYWRRINIYWKDFMVRVVFNPLVFRLKHRPRPLALAVATAAVFLVTWLLHAYQSFWLRGIWGFSVPDALFWGSLGLLVMINVQLDASRSAHRRRGRSAAGWAAKTRRLALQSIQVACMFTTISLLWSLWSSPSLGAWVNMLRRGFHW